MINMVNDAKLSSSYKYIDDILRTFPSRLYSLSSVSDRVLSFLPIFPDKNLYYEYENFTHLIEDHTEHLVDISKQISQRSPSFPKYFDMDCHTKNIAYFVQETKSLQCDVQKFLGLHERIRSSLPHKEPFSSLEYAIDQSLNSCRQFSELLENLQNISSSILDCFQKILEEMDPSNNAMFTRIPHDFL